MPTRTHTLATKLRTAIAEEQYDTAAELLRDYVLAVRQAIAGIATEDATKMLTHAQELIGWARLVVLCARSQNERRLAELNSGSRSKFAGSLPAAPRLNVQG